MFIELVDSLRCPNQHDESWMVASADRMEARHIVTGTLGCPICSAEFPISNGVVDFRSREPREEPAPPRSGDAVKLAALLALTDAQGFAVLLDGWGALGHELASLVETPLILVDPPERIVGAPGVSVIRCDGDIPLAAGTARGIAIDQSSQRRTMSALRVVRSGGRIVAPAAVPLPPGVTELARDDELWVGERESIGSPLVTLHVRRG
jgi:uncharacterized protein YbaR (Trm112 family)